MKQTKKKPIILKRGCKKKLAEACRVSLITVYNAMHWETDSDLQEYVRNRAAELGYIKRF